MSGSTTAMNGWAARSSAPPSSILDMGSCVAGYRRYRCPAYIASNNANMPNVASNNASCVASNVLSTWLGCGGQENATKHARFQVVYSSCALKGEVEKIEEMELIHRVEPYALIGKTVEFKNYKGTVKTYDSIDGYCPSTSCTEWSLRAMP